MEYSKENNLGFIQGYPLLSQIGDESYHPRELHDLHNIARLFYKLYSDKHHDIIKNILLITCCIGTRTIFTEIKENWDGNRNFKRDKIMSEIQIIDKLLSKDRKSHIIPMVKRLKVERARLDTDLKMEIDRLNKLPTFDQSTIERRLSEIKKHHKFQRVSLTDDEILSLIFYCDYDYYCYELRKSHRNRVHTCLWRTLFGHICNAIKKLHKAFHHKNKRYLKNKYIRDYLFHGTTVNRLTCKQQKKLLMNTVTSFSHDPRVSATFAQPNGLVLVIENAKQAIYDGKIIAADVSWISAHGGEDEFIVLPTEYHDIKEISYEDIRKKHNDWLMPEQIRVYMTTEYSSHKHNPTWHWHGDIIEAGFGVLMIIFICWMIYWMIRYFLSGDNHNPYFEISVEVSQRVEVKILNELLPLLYKTADLYYSLYVSILEFIFWFYPWMYSERSPQHSVISSELLIFVFCISISVLMIHKSITWFKRKDDDKHMIDDKSRNKMDRRDPNSSIKNGGKLVERDSVKCETLQSQNEILNRCTVNRPNSFLSACGITNKSVKLCTNI